MSTLTSSNPPAARRFAFNSWHLGLLFLLVAIGFAAYMSYMKVAGQALACEVGDGSIFNCNVVENSRWAYIVGIPTAIWGLGWYTVILASLIGQRTVPFLKTYGVPLTFAMALFAFGYHSYLTYTAFNVIGRLCVYCIGAHTAMTLFLLVSTYRFIGWIRTPQAHDATTPA